MPTRRARASASYPSRLYVPFKKLKPRHQPPWASPAERAQVLAGAFFEDDPARRRAVESELELASHDGIDEDRLCAALCAAILDYYGELVQSRETRTLRQHRARASRLRRHVLPLLEELRYLGNPEVQALVQSLIAKLKDGGNTGWTWFAKRSRQPGNPFERVLTRARQRLAEVGVMPYNDQTDWLRLVGLLPEQRDVPNPRAATGRVRVSFAPWLGRKPVTFVVAPSGAERKQRSRPRGSPKKR